MKIMKNETTLKQSIINIMKNVTEKNIYVLKTIQLENGKVQAYGAFFGDWMTKLDLVVDDGTSEFSEIVDMSEALNKEAMTSFIELKMNLLSGERLFIMKTSRRMQPTVEWIAIGHDEDELDVCGMYDKESFTTSVYTLQDSKISIDLAQEGYEEELAC